MTTGALIFAFNNEETDYVSMAAWCAKNVRRHLGIPVAVVTNVATAVGFDHVILVEAEAGGTRYFEDYDATVTWHNAGRVDAYHLSPFDCTLVLDADYVVAGNSLKVLLSSPEEFLAHRWAYDVTGNTDFSEYNFFGDHRMPMWWATVMMFRRSARTQQIFEIMTMVKHNWPHYKRLYRSSSKAYRNDHALSVALGVVNGHAVDHHGIPWKLATLEPKHKITQTGTDSYQVEYIGATGRPQYIQLHNQDFHALGKQQLGEIIANSC
jgi:hypothetical protein